MKRYLSGLLTGVLLTLLLTASSLVLANQDIKIIVNGQTLNPSTPPQIVDGRTMVPLAVIAQALNCDVNWDSGQNAVIIKSREQGSSQVSQNNNNQISQPLILSNISETTYKLIPNSTEKLAYVTVTITNTSAKYISWVRLKPILNVNDGRSFMSALDESSHFEGEYFSPNSTYTLTYWARIPNEINIIKWELP